MSRVVSIICLRFLFSIVIVPNYLCARGNEAANCFAYDMLKVLK